MNGIYSSNQYAIDDLKTTVKIKQDESTNIIKNISSIIGGLVPVAELMGADEEDSRKRYQR